MNYNQIMADLKNRIYKPLYFLHGEEPYFIDSICDYIDDNVLNESEKAFNHSILYGKDVNLIDVIEAARRFPMMASHQVIIVKEAQNIRDFKLLSDYLNAPMQSTILVFAHKYKKVDKRLKVFKDIEKKAILFESAKLYDNQVGPWIVKYLEAKSKTIHPVAVALITECLGSDLSRVVSELNKLLVVLPKDQVQISEDMVKDNIGIHRDFNVFELQKALGFRDSFKAFQIIDYFAHDLRK
ncbi:MAG: DNA polymerase III subunit delta, partial [Bacteroidales bacterium]|nr:DNA polymerase III subunit delta [Bacteroidales bacterium]